MEHVVTPLSGANAQLAQRALSLLQLNGQAQSALPLLASALTNAQSAATVQVTNESSKVKVVVVQRRIQDSGSGASTQQY